MSNISPDLIWEVTRPHNAYLVKRKSGGGVSLSRDPLNLLNFHSRKYNGFSNEKAIGVHQDEKGAIVFSSKKTKSSNKPNGQLSTSSWGTHKPARKSYRSIARQSTQNNYRPDLRAAAVARASAIRKSQKPVKDAPESKPRGAKARAAEGK